MSGEQLLKHLRVCVGPCGNGNLTGEPTVCDDRGAAKSLDADCNERCAGDAHVSSKTSLSLSGS